MIKIVLDANNVERTDHAVNRLARISTILLYYIYL